MALMKHLGKKMPPGCGQEAIQMFSQRNNPYCDLLSASKITYNLGYANGETKISLKPFRIYYITNK